ncbi:ATPase P [Helicobacter didelphidarum]|uniref:Copper-transporting ATPase n=1 Tax=Helicobacter didelphidarum TaxID=2040648 RepID=A0A3D8IM77_9HELI|nr:heavy metal translocating P-type ATPase [Helicobacter didelphidarum]RDU66223.1 ATPase P [Helicobacter didelphidarum]
MQKISCSHCKQEYTDNMLKIVRDTQSGETLYFCCNGCELAFQLLRENNLESFYTKLGNNALETKNIQDSIHTNLNYDSINFKQKYVKDQNGYKEVHFILDGVVCAACVWLNEQILLNLNGIKELKINYTTHKAKVLFDENTISLATIIQNIRKIGYNAIVYNPQEKENKDSQRNRIYYIKLVIAIFCTMNIMWVNVGQYLGFFSGIDSISTSILNLASFILATPVLFFSASGFYKQAFLGLKHGIIGMEMLVITGTSLVYFYSIYAWLSQSGHTYFESVCMIILFVLSAKFLESLSKKSANDNLDKLNNILPLEARLEDDSIISVYDIKIGDKLLVLPGETIACDGTLESSFATFDYSNINGESVPINIKKGEPISSGAIAINTALYYNATKEFKNSSMSKLANLLKESEFSTPKIASFAFRIAGYFSKIVLSIAFLGFCYYYFFAQSDFEYALLIAVSVIVIACPCALALATPIASVVGLNVGFKNHIIYTKADFLESLAKADCVVFDKTGTLTEGKMRVIKVEKPIYSHAHNTSIKDLAKNKDFKSMESVDFTKKQQEALQSATRFYVAMRRKNDEFKKSNGNVLDSDCKSLIIKAMQKNPHIIAKAIMEYFKEDSQTDLLESNKHKISQNIESDKSNNLFELIEGRGFYAVIDDVEIIGGNEKLINEKLSQDSNAPFALTHIFYLQDSVKSGARELIQSLNKLKKKTIILSGDRFEAVKSLANTLDISEYYSGHTPLQKAEFIKKMVESKHTIVMIGDGLNDSLALKYAQVGIVMGSGSEISIAHSDIIILDDSLESLHKAFKISNLTFKRIQENLIMSLIYNACAIPFALCGFVIPLFAALFMSISSISVVLNSLRLYKNKL